MMREHVEIQARKKAHELVLMVLRDKAFSKLKGKIVVKLKDSVVNIPAELFESHGRFSDNDKIKYLSRARGYLYEVKYHIGLLKDLDKINTYTKRKFVLKIDLLDKLLVGMIKEAKRREDSGKVNVNYFYKLNSFSK